MKKEFTTATDPTVLVQHAERTITCPTDAIIELVTNSDDAFEKQEKQEGGLIKVVIERYRGSCEGIEVRDDAKGMSKEKLLSALEIYGKVIQKKPGEKRRGLLNRGLKEAIAVFRKAEIITCDGKEVGWRIVSRVENSELKHRGPEELHPREKSKLLEKSGTYIHLIKERKDKPEKFKIADAKKLEEQISKHWALRDIVRRRKVWLTVKNLQRSGDGGSPRSSSSPLVYQPPRGHLFRKTLLEIPRYKEQCKLEIWKSDESMGKEWSPTSDAGICVKTQGTLIDFHHFGFKERPGFYYFFGTLECDGIYERENREKATAGIVDLDRGGLNWRKHPYCKCLEKIVADFISPFIKEKEREISTTVETTKEVEQKNKEIASFLSRLLAPELKDEGPGPGSLTALTIYPKYFHVPPDKERSIGIYAPDALVKKFGIKVKMESDSFRITVSPGILALKVGSKPGWYSGYAKVSGSPLGAYAIISAKLGDQEEKATVEIKPYGERPDEGDLSSETTRGGIFSTVEYEESPDSTFRARVTDGIIKINLSFPGLEEFLNKEGPKSEAGIAYYAEMVAETAFRDTATRRIIKGLISVTGDDREETHIETFKNEISRLQKQHLRKIHTYVASKFRK